jgi:nitroreductase
METAVLRSFKIFGTLLQKAGPYLLLEILLPGGTLFALLLFLYKRRQQSGAEMPRAILVVVRAIDKVRMEIVYVARLYGIASLWRGRARERDGLEALALAPNL